MNSYSPHKTNPFRLALTLSFPVFLSYFSLGIVFGILFDHLHQPWYFAPIMSLFAYSGAVQFVTIGIMHQHGSYLLILLSTIFIAARNSFYGLSFLKRFQVSLWKKAILIFTLVDTNYAVLNSNPPYHDKKQDEQFCLYLGLLICSYWVMGTLIGAFFSNRLPHLQGLEFVLVAFFAILIFENYLKFRSIEPVMIGLIALIIALIAVPFNMMLLTGILISCVLQILFYFKGKKHDPM
ncbi:MAG: AzlC family ABC transporter permease [Coxiellaceae bacterium]|nr:AzlC family ABC transporter permease [Coxiellaceae bacterium]